jgi:hypothetical protein
MTWQTVAEAAYRLPLIWLCCFRQSDLLPGVVIYQNPDGTERRREIQLPCASREIALENIKQSFPVIEAIIGDAALAREYWQDALLGIRCLRLPYLTMYVDEIVDGDYVGFVAALSGGADAIPHLIKFSGYDTKSLPYSLDAWHEAPAGRNNDPRRNNTLALGGGFGLDTPESGPDATLAYPGVNPAWTHSWKSFKKWGASDHQNLRLSNDQSMEYFAVHGEPMSYLLHGKQDTQPPRQPWELISGSHFSIFSRYACHDLVLCGMEKRVFDTAIALDAFAASGLQVAIGLYMEHFFPLRFSGRMLQQMDLSRVQHTALGIVIGCCNEGFCLARMQVHAFRKGYHKRHGEQAPYRFLLRLLTAFLNEPPLPQEDISEPALTTLLEVWRAPEPQALVKACLDVCDFRTHTLERHDEWSRIPIEVLLVFKLRALLGLANPLLDHPLLNGGLGQLPPEVDFAPQGLIGSLRQRLMQLGFSERTIFEQVYEGPTKAAMLAGWPDSLMPSTVPSTAGAAVRPVAATEKKIAAPGIHGMWLQDWRTARDKYVSGRVRDHQENIQALCAYAYGPDAAVPLGALAVPPTAISLSRLLDQELMRYANARIFELEIRLVEEAVFDRSLAHSAFAAAYLEQMLSLHRHTQDKPHQNCKKLTYKMVPFVALGVVAGDATEVEAAFRLSRMLFQAQRKTFYGLGSCKYPIFNFMLRLLSDHLGKGPMFVESHRDAAPIFNPLFEIWREPNAQRLVPGILHACDYHTHRFVSGEAEDYIEFNHGRWSRIPIEILLLFKLRQIRGLSNPQLDHPLMPATFPVRPDTSQPVKYDKLIADIRLKMKQDGFDEAAVESSMSKSGIR